MKNRQRNRRKNRRNRAAYSGSFPAAGTVVLFGVLGSCWLLGKSVLAEEAEQYEPPRLVISEPESGTLWYQDPPEVKIIHMDPDTVTRYLIRTPSGKETEGELRIKSEETEEPDETEMPEEPAESEGEEAPEGSEMAGETEMPEEPAEPEGEEAPEEPETTGEEETPEKPEISEEAGIDNTQVEPVTEVLSREIWEEGENHLLVWMEKIEDGTEVYREEQKIRLDESMPGKVSFTCRDPAGGYFSSPTKIEVRASDKFSGVREIICTAGNRKKRIEGGHGTFEIPLGFAGKITAHAVDNSGREGPGSESSWICCEDEAPLINMYTGQEEGVWNDGAVTVRLEVCEPGEKYGFSSGLKSVTYYVNGQAAGRKEYPDGSTVCSDSLGFPVDETSQNGEEIQIMAHALDRAGNTSVRMGKVFIDTKIPVISIKGIKDAAITGEDTVIEVSVSEENILSEGKVRIFRTTPGEEKKEVTDMTLEPQDRSGQVFKKEMHLQESGMYECIVTAADAAGHEAEENITFTIDHDSPVIKYVEQMNGANIRFFQWNYGREEMIQDLTEYSYVMYLNGNPYFSGDLVTEEGEKLLEVRAEDAAGNVSFAEAAFTVDHTPPVIHWGESENGGKYDGSAILSLWVDGTGERIRELHINRERQKISADSRVFQYEITESGQYTVDVKADDLAGNETVEQISFEVREQSGFAGSVIEPVRRIFSGNREKREVQEENVHDGGGPALGVLAAIGAAVVVCAFYTFYKRQKGAA
ncbi:MAG TPA: hypothetical protein H9695_10770 [Candidatus Mediterraneibacter excrementigallinarum]|nr:hypothetical protein [Candidatus Mediterraneibacter excrementigallinarum]